MTHYLRNNHSVARKVNCSLVTKTVCVLPLNLLLVGKHFNKQFICRIRAGKINLGTCILKVGN